MNNLFRSVLLVLPISLLSGSNLLAQPSLVLSSGSAPASSAVTLNLALTSPAGSEPAGIQWSFNYPAGSVTNFAVTAGPALNAAAKTLNCTSSSGSYTCVTSGMNTNLIANGNVATVSVTLAATASSAPIGISGAVGVAIDGKQVAINPTGGTVSAILTSGLSGISCSPSTLAPGAVAACTVTLGSPVATGATVALSSTGSISMPSTVSIPANAAGATFNVTAGSFTAAQTATATATLNGVSRTASLSLVVQVTLNSLSCSSISLGSLLSTACTVTLSSAAPAGGASVALSSSAITALTVPASITVPASATTATFTATALSVITSQTAIVTATLSGTSRTVTMTVSPAAAVTLTSLNCASTSLPASSSTTCTVTLSKAAPSGGASVALSSSATSTLTVPASVTVPASATTATFTATAKAVSSNQTATITATLSGTSGAVTMTVSPAGAVTLSSLTCASTNLAASSSTTCVVILSKAAPSGGISVTLSSSATSTLTVPASVTVPASATAANFTVTAAAVSSNQTAIVTAALNGTSQPVTMTVTAAAVTLTSLNCASTSLAASSSTTCTVTLSKAAPSGGTSVALSSSATSTLTVPVSITVPASSTTATFTTTAQAVSSNQTATITASLNGTTQLATVTVTATAPTLTSLTCASTSLPASSSTTCTVTLSKAAPSGGTNVSLSTNAPATVAVPPSITVPAAATTASFVAAVSSVTSNRTATVTASIGPSTSSVTLSVVVTTTISSLTCTSTTLPSSGSTVCTATVTQPAPGGGTLLTVAASPASLLTLPGSVTVASGTSTATFTVQAGNITLDQTGSVTVSLGSSSMTVALSLASPAMAPSSLTCAASTLTANTNTVCTVQINHPAPAGGTQVSTSSSIPASLSVPASVTVPAGSSSANFTASAGAISAGQGALVRAQIGQASISFPIALSPLAAALSQLSCSPMSLAPGSSGTCTITLTAPAATALNVAVFSTNTGLTVPSSITVPGGSSSATFTFRASSSMTGWAIVYATLGSVAKGLSITALPPSDAAPATASALRLHCDQRLVTAGDTAVCEILYNSNAAADAADFAISSSSQHVKTPATVRGRAGWNSLRFEVSTDEEGPQESVSIEARSGSDSASESLMVMSSGSLHLRVPREITARPGSPARFTASATDDQGLPVSLAVASLPDGAKFDEASGLFEWTPSDRDLGLAAVSFTAANSLGLTSTKTVKIQVVSSRPRLTALRNAAGSSAVAACSPGARATLVGSSLAGGPAADSIRVLVNGTETSITQASDGQVQFLCPSLAPGTPLAIAVNVGDQVSNEVRSVMRETAPGLFSADGSGTGQGLVVHARGLAALPRFERAGMPAAAGDEITLFATGISCDPTSGAPRPLLYFGHDYQPITLLRPSALPGVCEIHSVVPAGLAGGTAELVLESTREDGSAARSNTILVAIEP